MIVLTQGDPDGIGPELVVRAAVKGLLRAGDRVVAHRSVLRRAAGALGESAQRALQQLEPSLAELDSPMQTEALRVAVDLVLERPESRALVTAPIDKSVAQAEGLEHPGHTEYLAARSNTSRFGMLMLGPKLRVALATIHMPLAQVPAALSRERIEAMTTLLYETLVVDVGLEHPTIGVLGLNPHAGEHGLLGSEEQTIIGPACEQLRAMGLDVRGPLPADTAMFYAARGDLDGVVAMYHDQGLAPFKLIHFDDGVNVTMGLPFVRTSPDHGTAKDIAGRGRANPSSFFAAIAAARQMLARRAGR